MAEATILKLSSEILLERQNADYLECNLNLKLGLFPEDAPCVDRNVEIKMNFKRTLFFGITFLFQILKNKNDQLFQI